MTLDSIQRMKRKMGNDGQQRQQQDTIRFKAVPQPLGHKVAPDEIHFTSTVLHWQQKSRKQILEKLRHINSELSP